ncbi:MAG: hypothetical protein WC929_00530 [Bacilli bacterium]|jgi:hypothetical protein
MKQTRLVEFQRPKFGALRKQDREAIYQAVRNRFGPNHSISMSELEYEYKRKTWQPIPIPHCLGYVMCCLYWK